uniref:Uncharacterized protein n=1 Tax=Tetradesmus obliquus TaxID=3088 RepID=A0A383VF35_TETOB
MCTPLLSLNAKYPTSRAGTGSSLPGGCALPREVNPGCSSSSSSSGGGSMQHPDPPNAPVTSHNKACSEQLSAQQQLPGDSWPEGRTAAAGRRSLDACLEAAAASAGSCKPVDNAESACMPLKMHMRRHSCEALHLASTEDKTYSEQLPRCQGMSCSSSPKAACLCCDAACQSNLCDGSSWSSSSSNSSSSQAACDAAAAAISSFAGFASRMSSGVEEEDCLTASGWLEATAQAQCAAAVHGTAPRAHACEVRSFSSNSSSSSSSYPAVLRAMSEPEPADAHYTSGGQTELAAGSSSSSSSSSSAAGKHPAPAAAAGWQAAAKEANCPLAHCSSSSYSGAQARRQAAVSASHAAKQQHHMHHVQGPAAGSGLDIREASYTAAQLPEGSHAPATRHVTIATPAHQQQQQQHLLQHSWGQPAGAGSDHAAAAQHAPRLGSPGGSSSSSSSRRGSSSALCELMLLQAIDGELRQQLQAHTHLAMAHHAWSRSSPNMQRAASPAGCAANPSPQQVSPPRSPAPVSPHSRAPTSSTQLAGTLQQLQIPIPAAARGRTLQEYLQQHQQLQRGHQLCMHCAAARRVARGGALDAAAQGKLAELLAVQQLQMRLQGELLQELAQ